MPDPSFFIPLLVQSALIPFGVALVALVALRRCAAGPSALAAVAAGFIASYFTVYGSQWSAAPRQALDWIAPIVVLGGAAAWAIEGKARAAGVGFVARFVVSALAAGVLVAPAAASLSAPSIAAYVLAAGIAIGAAWSWLAGAPGGAAAPTVIAIVAGGSALALMIDASQSIGQLGGALASAVLAWLAFGLVRRRAEAAPAAVGLSVLLLGSLLLTAHRYAGFPLAYVAILAGAILAHVIVYLPLRLKNRVPGTGAWLASAALAGVPVLLVVGLALKAMQDSGGY